MLTTMVLVVVTAHGFGRSLQEGLALWNAILGMMNDGYCFAAAQVRRDPYLK